MSFKQKRTVLFGECDPAGIMYTPSITHWLVEATLSFLSDCMGRPVERYMYSLNISLPARALNMEFLKSMTWDEEIEVEVSLAEMRTRSFTVAVSGANAAGEQTFKGLLTMVTIAPSEKKAVPIPEEIRKALQGQV